VGQAAQVSSLERDRSGLRRSKFASTCSNALISNTCHRFFFVMPIGALNQPLFSADALG
jgi:hypothetical protein